LFESFKIKDYLPADSQNSSGFFFKQELEQDSI